MPSMRRWELARNVGGAIAALCSLSWVGYLGYSEYLNSKEVFELHRASYLPNVATGRINASITYSKWRDSCIPTEREFFFRRDGNGVYPLTWDSDALPLGENVTESAMLSYNNGQVIPRGAGEVYGHITFGGECGGQRIDFEPYAVVVPPILEIHEFHYDNQLPSGMIPARFLITKWRDDCAPTILKYHFIDELGFRHRMEWTGAPAPTGVKTWTKYNIRFAPGSIPTGPGQIHGSITYGGKCGGEKFVFEARPMQAAQAWWKPD